MKNCSFKIFIILLFIPFFVNADWILLFSKNEGDLYIDSQSINRKKNRIFFSQLVNYNTKKSSGASSFVSFSELDCKNLKVRDLKYELFINKMGKGKNIYNGKPTKKWRKYEKGTSAFLLNKLMCERVHIK